VAVLNTDLATLKMKAAFLLSTLCFALSISQVFPREDTVALIVGGIAEGGTEAKYSVELFGCPAQESVPVANYPGGPSYLVAGAYVESIDAALVCGGISTPGFDTSDRCFQWDSSNQWTEVEHLIIPRQGHVMVNGPNLDDRPEMERPIILDFNNPSEAYNYDNWDLYKSLPNRGIWSSSDCVVQVGNLVYFAQQTVEVLDLETWEIKTIGSVPYRSTYFGKCAFTEVSDRKGKRLYGNTILNKSSSV